MKIVVTLQLDGRDRSQRQKNADARSLRGFAIDVNEASVGRDNVMNGGKAQPRALARLGRKEGLEKMSSRGGVHSEAVVGNREQRAWQRRSAHSQTGIGQHFHFAIRGLNRDSSTPWHGVARVEDEVEQDLLGLGRIHLDQAQMRIELKAQLDGLPDQTNQQVAHALRDFVQRERARLVIHRSRDRK